MASSGHGPLFLGERVLTIVLALNPGARLFPLTADRAKAALPFVGKYRLIDFPLSACLNAGLRRIYVLTQFNSASLNRHIMEGYRFSSFAEPAEFVEVLAAEQTFESTEWLQSPPDAIRRAWRYFDQWKATDYLVIAGDEIWDLDLGDLVWRHWESGAEITLPVVPVDETRAPHCGLVQTDSSGRVIRFEEQPKGPVLELMRWCGASLEFRQHNGPTGTKESPATDAGRSPSAQSYLASPGVYLFKREVLRTLLEAAPMAFDFGMEILPQAVTSYYVMAYLHRGVWDDLATIGAYYHASMRLLDPLPRMNLYDPQRPIYARPTHLPPAKVRECCIRDSLVGDGSILAEAEVSHSILGLRTRVGVNTRLEDVITFGASYIQSPEEIAEDRTRGVPAIGIGDNTIIRRAIIDRDARIGSRVKILNEAGVLYANGTNYYIRDGLIVIPRDAVIPDDTVI
ncbi:MAG TPA: sugar phosphate nucleotidyltransferase [Blastocatellia bacterium]|nr:sugar phosphate nucleotidyltransferase [Blastocatellia bacterium]